MRRTFLFKTKVVKVHRSNDKDRAQQPGTRSKWLINDGEDGEFDAVICTVGTCGKPTTKVFEGEDVFEENGGWVVHSSELDKLSGSGSDTENDSSEKTNGHANGHSKEPFDVKGKTMIIVGSGASSVEAAEWAVEKGADKVWILAR